MKKTVVLDVVGLTPGLLGEWTPFLRDYAGRSALATVVPPLPAVTCPVQATYLTGLPPARHGVVANGWYDREYSEVWFWRQSNRLVQGRKLWETARRIDPNFTCANLFWWFNMYSGVDFSVTPRPIYTADGLKIPDIYTEPSELRGRLQRELGAFPLFNFWGPAAGIASSRWIGEAAKRVEEWHDPTLTLIYLPHLDYDLQRWGPGDTRACDSLRAIDDLCREVVTFYEQRQAQVVILSEYGITPVSRPISLNRVLRRHGLLQVREERGGELLDAGASQAFAVADHQVAHVYVKERSLVNRVRRLLEETEGVEQLLGREELAAARLEHPRAGELVAVAERDAWFTYYYWDEARRAPDFARLVEIHRKPGYDPVELFIDPAIRFPSLAVGWRLLKRRLGLHTLMDLIPLDPTLVRGSHGRASASQAEAPLFITPRRDLLSAPEVAATEVHDLLLAHLLEKPLSKQPWARLAKV